MQTTVVYPGTFDPLTYGHLDVIDRAAKLFPKVYVAIAAAHHKKTLFSLAERVALVEKTVAHYTNVVVIGFEGLLLELMQAHHIRVILRGVRGVSDFDYEFQLARVNRAMQGDIESVFLMPSEQYQHLAASFVREIASLGGDIRPFVPDLIRVAMENKFIEPNS